MYHNSCVIQPDNSHVNMQYQDAQAEQQNQPSTETKGNSGVGRSTQRKQSEVFLVGDSILKNLQGRKMSSTAKVKISSFSECSTQDMRGHIRPILWKNPDEIVIHVSTNSLRSSTSARMC